MDAAFRTATHIGRHGTVTLPGRCDQAIGIARIHDDIGDTGPFACGQDEVPAFTAIGGLVEATLAAGGPERALGGDPDRIAVIGVDEDFGDVLGGFQAKMVPALTAVA